MHRSGPDGEQFFAGAGIQEKIEVLMGLGGEGDGNLLVDDHPGRDVIEVGMSRMVAADGIAEQYVAGRRTFRLRGRVRHQLVGKQKSLLLRERRGLRWMPQRDAFGLQSGNLRLPGGSSSGAR